MSSRARPKRCLAGFRASFCFSFWQRGAGEQAEQNEKQNENKTKNNVEVGPWTILAASVASLGRPGSLGEHRRTPGGARPRRKPAGTAADYFAIGSRAAGSAGSIFWSASFRMASARDDMERAMSSVPSKLPIPTLVFTY